MVAIAQKGDLNMSLTYDQFYTMTYASDLDDIIAKYEGVQLRPLKCSFLLRVTGDQMFTSHTTWYYYTGLLRTYKVLNFDLSNPLAQTKRVSFSSQPGYATSQDDFYILDNNKFVAETSLGNYNNSVYDWIHYDSIPYWVRITVANFVFKDQKTWVDTYFRERSGTYANQWLVVDYDKFEQYKSNFSAGQDVIWMVEEFYGFTSVNDLTATMLAEQNFVASYNVPYDPTIEKVSQYPNNYTTAPRYHLF